MASNARSALAFRYNIGLIAITIGLGMQYALLRSAQAMPPGLILIPATVAAALAGGMWLGLAVACIGCFSLEIVLGEGHGRLGIEIVPMMRTAATILIAGGAGYFADALRRARAQASEEAERAHQAETTQQGISRDLEERVRARTIELETARGLLEGLVEGSGDMIAALDTQFRYIACNKAYRDEFREIFGREVRIGASIVELLAEQPQDQDQMIEAWGRALRGERFTVEGEFGDPSRQRNWYQLGYSPVYGRDGKLIGAAQIVRDITERRRVEEELRQANEQLEQRVEQRTQAIRESELRTRRILDASPIGTLVIGAQGQVREVNRAFLEMVGRSQSQVAAEGLDWRWITPEEYRESDEQAVREAAEHGVSLIYEKEFARPDGSRVPVLMAYAATGGASGELVAFALDMTDRKRTENALREERMRLEQSLRHMPAGVIIVSAPSGEVLYANEAAERIFGPHTPAAQIAQRLLMLDGSAMAEGQFPAARVIRDGEAVLGQELLAERQDGSRIVVSVNAAPLKGSDERIVAVIVALFDITGSKHAQEQAATARRTLDTALASIAEGFTIFDHDWRFIYANDRGLDLLCVKREQMMGKVVWEVAPGLKETTLYREMMRCQREQQPVEFEEYSPYTRRWFASRVYPSAYGITHVFTDVTARKQAEAALMEAKRAAEAASKAKDEFLAVLSHELRTPLTPVLAVAQVMEQDAQFPHQWRESIAMIQRNVELEARLIDDLLDLTRIVHGKINLNLEDLSIHEMIGHVTGICAADIVAKEITLRTELEAEHDRVRADPARMQQILWNLLRNAVKFTPRGGKITVWSGNSKAGTIRVKVTDTGVGIDPQVMPRLFNAFEQGTREVTQAYGGLGLGLSISKGLADLHNGTLRARSEGRNRGAEFELELPAVSGGLRPPPARPPLVSVRPKGWRVLLVEDHPDTAKATMLLLRRWGCDVRHAETLAEAKQLRDQHQFDLAISDIGLPDGTGYELMRELAARGVRGIALSGYGQETDIARSREAGFAEHLTKPVSLDVLRAAMERAMRAGA